MGRLLRIELENFKSYRGRHVIGPFEQFTCIIGPNGAGKSNLMDAISFVLAVPTKYLRSHNLQELVYHNDETDQNAGTCSVSLIYLTDEQDHRLNEEIQPGEEIEFFRRVNANGSSQFKINGRQISSEDYIEKLAKHNILVSCRNFIVYQGDVQNISTRSPEELTMLFEQISGSHTLKGEYERLREQREQLKQVLDINLKRKYTMISEKKVVQEQKEEADEYQKKQSALRDLRVKYYLWQLYYIESKLEKHRNEEKRLEDKCNGIDNEHGTYREEKDRYQRELAALRESQRKLENDRRDVEEQIRNIQPECVRWGNKKRRHQKEMDRLTTEQRQLLRDQETLAQEQETLIVELGRMQTTLQTLQESLPTTQNGVALTDEQKERYQVLQGEFMKEAGTLIQENEMRKREQETVEAQIKQKAEQIGSHVNEMDNTKRLVEELRTQQQRLEQSKGNTELMIQQLEAQREYLQNEYQTSLKDLRKKRADAEQMKKELQGIMDVRDGEKRKNERRACVNLLKQSCADVRGLLVELVVPSQDQYALAVETALGKHLDAVVVNTKAAAIDCIQFLKEQHMPPMDFYPLDSLRCKDIREELRLLPCHLCKDLIEYDPSVEVAVRYALGNTVVAETLEIARTLAFTNRIHERVITLEGEEISKNGAMTGGVPTRRGGTFQEHNLYKRQEELEKLEATCQELERSLQRNSQNSDQVRSIESELRTQRGKLDVFEEELKVLRGKLEGYASRLATLETTLSEEKQEEIALKITESKLVNALSRLQQQTRVVERQVYGAFLDEIGIMTIQQLENEYLSSLRENEGMQAECRTHIALLESKQEYGQQRLDTLAENLRKVETELEQAKEKIEEAVQATSNIEGEMTVLEERKEEIEREIGKTMKSAQDVEVKLQKIDHRLREHREKLKKTRDRISSERCAMETLRSKRNAVLKSAMIEQVQLPLIASASSHSLSRQGSVNMAELQTRTSVSLSRSSTASLSEGESSQMEVEESPRSSMGTPGFSQSQALVVQHDQEQVDQIDFSSLKEDMIVSNEQEYIIRDREYRDRLSKLSTEVDKMSPNMYAEKRYNDITKRVGEMNEARQAMVRDYSNANTEFRRCCENRKEMFMIAYEQVERTIDLTYKDLTRSPQFASGGQALLALTNPDEPYLGGVKYTVSPVGKQYRDISQLSGGEKTIATLALLFSLHSCRQAPFFILDEVDDALDNANVERVAKYMEEFSKSTQCIIISHKDLLYEKSDSLVGVYHSWQEASSAILTLDLRKYDPENGIEEEEEEA